MDFHILTEEAKRQLNLDSLPDETAELIITTLGENILERALLSVAEAVTEEEASTITSLLSTSTSEEATKFLLEKHPNLDTVIAGIRDDVVNEFLESHKVL